MSINTVEVCNKTYIFVFIQINFSMILFKLFYDKSNNYHQTSIK